MGRIFLTLILAVALAVTVAWYFDVLSVPGEPARDPLVRTSVVPPEQLGDWLYDPAPEDKKPRFDRRDSGREPIVIPAHLEEIDTLDVPSTIPGQILYVGNGVPEGVAQMAGVAALMNDNYKQATVRFEGRDWVRFYKPLDRKDEVLPGQMIAEMDFAQALYAHKQHEALLARAHAELKAAEEVDYEARERLRIDLNSSSSEREKSDARLTRVRTFQEIVKTREEIKKEEIELNNAKTRLDYHQVHPKRHLGRVAYIKTIYHNTGEAVKEHEPILQLYSIDRLMAVSFVDIQFVDRLRPLVNQKRLATIEPVIDQEPLRRFEGHRPQPIIGVRFVQHEGATFVVSAGEDGYVKVWHQQYVGPVAPDIYLGEPIKSLACSPAGDGPTLCLVGMGDGKIHVWDLFPGGKLTKPVKVGEPIEAHGDAVTALAFSLDGKYFASGAADGSIKLWQTDGQLVYAFQAAHGVDNPHQGSITDLHFTPQSQLVSAGRDNALRVWNLKQKGAHLEGTPLAGRGGAVSQLGVSSDGRTMLFDQGRSLQLLSVADSRLVNIVRNPGEATPFETVAIFSPDSSLILTGGLPDGRLQLWRSPVEAERGFEVRQFRPSYKTPVTCAAFAPQGPGGAPSFAASGSKDGIVYLWPVPGKKDVDNHCLRNLPVTLVAQTVEAGSRQVRLGVEVSNLEGRLTPGRPVTIVVE